MTPRELIANGYLHLSAEEARAAVESRSHGGLDWFARECEPIVQLRRCISQLDPSGKFSQSVLICAPHTHWHDSLIIQSYDVLSGVYLNGPSHATESANLRPVSFAFTESGPVPYEWADESVPIAEVELTQVTEFIDELCRVYVRSLSYSPPVVGVLIDHRFKLSVFEHRIFTFAEGPHDELSGRAVVRPIIQSVGTTYFQDPEIIQSAWTALDIDTCELSPAVLGREQIAFLEEMKNELSSMRWDDAICWYRSMLADLETRP